jgi:hypothetical protein
MNKQLEERITSLEKKLEAFQIKNGWIIIDSPVILPYMRSGGPRTKTDELVKYTDDNPVEVPTRPVKALKKSFFSCFF